MTIKDHADVLGRPPLLYATSLIVALLLQQFWPSQLLTGASVAWGGMYLLAADVGLVMWGRRSLLAANTAVDPSLPTRTIVTSGPFRFSRNPLYVGLTLIYLDFTLIANSWWGVVLLCPVLIFMHFGVVRREERYLDSKFGERYRRYCASVPRYL
jgi:protein-S-isoprenylcysteine O-methyltransferase Ste14